MAAHGWRKSPSVEAWLFEEGYAFDFFQAVSLLEKLMPDAAPLGETADPAAEAVRFSASISLSFPETDIARVEAPHYENTPAKMLVNFLSLAGALGPLPLPFAERLLQRAVRGDIAGREFLNIFHHRLISLSYRIRKMHRIGLGVRSPEEDAAARYLFSFLGLGLPPQKGRLGFPDRALLEHAGTLSNETRSMEGLLAILRRHFGISIEAISLSGTFHTIEASDRTALGRSGQNRALGKNAALGGRFWDQESSFELRLGPMHFETFARFLPRGDALMPLCEMIRFYVGDRFHFSLVLILARAEAPPLRIGKQSMGYLGQTTWLGEGKEAKGRELCVRLSRAAIRKAEEGRKAKGSEAPGAA